MQQSYIFIKCDRNCTLTVTNSVNQFVCVPFEKIHQHEILLFFATIVGCSRLRLVVLFLTLIKIPTQTYYERLNFCIPKQFSLRVKHAGKMKFTRAAAQHAIPVALILEYQRYPVRNLALPAVSAQMVTYITAKENALKKPTVK